MNSPLPQNVAAFSPRGTDEQAQHAAPSTPSIPGRTIAKKLPAIFKALAARFKEDEQGGYLYVDHADENLKNQLVGVSEFEGIMVFRHGLLIDEDFSAPKGKLRLPDQTVVITEGAVVRADIECKKLINLGKLEGAVKARGLLINYGEIDGDCEYGSLEVAGGAKFRGRLLPLAD